MIGIAISTRNRPYVLEYALTRFHKFRNDEQRIIVIDDHSDNAVRNMRITKNRGFEYYYNEQWMGIPKSKNRGFQLLRDCEWQFWFDDDCFPKVNGWEDPYIEAMQYKQHLLHSPQKDSVNKPIGNNILECSGATGVMMCFRYDLYDDMEYFYEGFQKWGHWHAALSRRFGGYYTIENSNDYIHSLDVNGKPDDYPHQRRSVFTRAEKNEYLRLFHESQRK